VTATRNDALRSKAATISSWEVKFAVAIALSASAAQLVDFALLDHRARWLDMDTHASVFGAVSLFALASAGIAAALLAISERPRTRASVLLPALLAILLALRLIHPVNVIFLALPFAAATFSALWQYDGGPSSTARRVIRTGCVVLLGSYVVRAVGGVLVSALDYSRHTGPYEAKLLVSHSSELAGWVIVATGLAAAYANVKRTG
jgi:hypothetical protein